MLGVGWEYFFGGARVSKGVASAAATKVGR